MKKYLITLLIITLWVYLPVSKIFFQQDEWISFGRLYTVSEFGAVETIKTFFAPAVGHYIPLTKFLTYYYFQVFKINTNGYVLESIGTHLLITILVYMFASKIFSNKIYALTVAAFFALNSSSHQATSWLVTDINIHMATIFALLSMISLISWHKVWSSIILLIISLLFKESSIGLFLILPLGVYLFSHDKPIQKLWISGKIMGSGVLYFLFRISMSFFQKAGASQDLVINSQSLYEILINLFTFPAKILAQTVLPTRWLLSLSRSFSKLFPQALAGVSGTAYFDKFVEGFSLQIIYWIIFIALILGIYFLIRRTKNVNLTKNTIFGLSFLFVNSLIYVLSPGRPGNIPTVDSRNLYFPLVGVSILVVSFFSLLFKTKIIRLVLAILLLITLHVYWLNIELVNLASTGKLRQDILIQIKNEHAILPEKVIFYTESDRAFYGLPQEDRILPFQSGLGQTLLVWYQETQKFPSIFFMNKFLWDITAQGYIEEDGIGFGYFRNYDWLKIAILQYKLPIDSIIGYRYDSKSNKLEDSTNEIQNKLRNDNETFY